MPLRQRASEMGSKDQPAGVRTSSPFWEGCLRSWIGALVIHPLGWGWGARVAMELAEGKGGEGVAYKSRLTFILLH